MKSCMSENQKRAGTEAFIKKNGNRDPVKGPSFTCISRNIRQLPSSGAGVEAGAGYCNRGSCRTGCMVLWCVVCGDCSSGRAEYFKSEPAGPGYDEAGNESSYQDVFPASA